MMKDRVWLNIFVIYLRYLLGFAFVFASLVKIQGLRFTAESGADNPINSAWHFFETLYESGLYWNFLGWAQFITGVLFLTQRYGKLGAVLFLPIIANIFVITISYDFRGTPIITGLMLLSTIFLLYWDWDSLKVLFNKSVTKSSKKILEHDVVWMYIGFIFLIITLCSKLILNDETMIFSFLSMFIIGVVGLIIGFRKRNQYLR